jgi:hypothetical protein
MSKKYMPLRYENYIEIKINKTHRFGPLFEIKMSKKYTRLWYKDIFSVAGAIQEICLLELLGGPGADFLREVVLWSIRSSNFLR